jgi:multiple antibiotic resistance protein
MEVATFTSVLLVAFSSLFPLVNPIGCAPIFLTLTQHYPHSVRRMLSRKIAFYAFAVLAVSLLVGTPILNFFGVSIVVIQIAGGLVLAANGWMLLNHKEQSASDSQAAASLDDALEHAFFPLTLPITVGPGCIAIAVILGAHLRHEAGPGLFGGIPLLFVAALAGMLLLCVLVWICYEKADRLVHALGKSGSTIVMRLSAFILFVIGVQISWNGLIAGIPQIIAAATSH